jgi:hypothetical protein
MRVLLQAALLAVTSLGPLPAAFAGKSTPSLQALSDAPDPSRQRVPAEPAPASYDDALAHWRSPQALSRWIGAHFEYDLARALMLSETARVAATRAQVHAPQAFFATPRGICVDLAHFAVATLRRIAPQADARYLMIEFEPISVQGHTLRRHWIASYRHEGALYFFADSKRPEHIAGPYETVDEFVRDYAQYRGRPIVSHRLADSYQRQLRQRAPRLAPVTTEIAAPD